MAKFEQREGSGSLFKNDRKEKDTHPNATGTALIGGVEYWVSAWTKKDKNGNPWQSLAFKPKEENGRRQGGQAEEPKRGGHDDGDIPFAPIRKLEAMAR
jgi:hypothetical protein